jgi:hypothetical protein
MPLCPYCGTDNREGAAFCVSCRRTIEPGEWLRPRTAPPPPVGAEPWDTQYYDRTPYQQPLYTLAAFWPRAGAWLLDLLFATLLAAIPGVILAIVLSVAVASTHDEPRDIFEEQDQEDEIVLSPTQRAGAGESALLVCGSCASATAPSRVTGPGSCARSQLYSSGSLTWYSS